jgi:hypothetical protein
LEPYEYDKIDVTHDYGFTEMIQDHKHDSGF